MSDTALKHSPLHKTHLALGARMTPFAGYDMPVSYGAGILAEHRWVREHAGLFDVSHMGPVFLSTADGDPDRAAAAFSTLVCSDIGALRAGKARYTLLMNDAGGIIDDLIVARLDDGRLYGVFNAARVEIDLAHVNDRCPELNIERASTSALIALQGPAARPVLARYDAAVADMAFMSVRELSLNGTRCLVSCSGYTGEDGFEILLPETDADHIAAHLLTNDEVRPAGLGARDSLRLEAGLCLWGQDIDETTSPVEAGLAWCVSRNRREKMDFPGAQRVLHELAHGPARVRIGLTLDGKAPARAGAAICTLSGDEIGLVTSGTPGPSTGTPVAMGYVAPEAANIGDQVHVMVRARPRPARISRMPFVSNRYWRAKP